jgi:radical SAM protein with 4Fe4S-binding SPASM domain
MPSGIPVTYTPLPDFSLWDKVIKNRKLISFSLEVTARCNNNCRHCYINLPASDRAAMKKELSVDEIGHIADEAVRLGALWCLVSGGEPLLRKDFKELYILIKKKGLLVTVFTNATLVTEEIVELFKKYPPRDIEISVYGTTRETYEKVTRKKGSFKAFMRGLNLLIDNGVPVNLKAMALKSNMHEMESIAKFCRDRSKAPYRYDPMLHLRYDSDPERNKEIIAERLKPEDIVFLEMNDPERFGVMKKKCDDLISTSFDSNSYHFTCGAGKSNFTVSYDGQFKLCSSLCAPGLIYDLRCEKTSIEEAFNRLAPQVFNLRSTNREFLESCGICPIKNLCICCSAHAWLETGQLDKPVDYFCSVARARASTLSDAITKPHS